MRRGRAHHAGGVAHDGGVRRDVIHHHRAGTHAGAVAHRDGAEEDGPGPDEHAVTQGGVALAAVLAGHAERRAMIHEAIVTDDGGPADDHADAVVDGESSAYPRGGMDVGAVLDAGAHGEPERERAMPPLVEPVLDAIGAHDAIARREARDVGDAVGRRVAREGRLGVLSDRGAQTKSRVLLALGRVARGDHGNGVHQRSIER